jgi:hypothetical protein
MRNAPAGTGLDTPPLIATSVTLCATLAAEIARSRELIWQSLQLRLATPSSAPSPAAPIFPKRTSRSHLIHVDCWRSRPVPRRPPTSAPARPAGA